MDLKDYAGAAKAFARGADIPHTHPFLKLLAAQMAQHAGERSTARMMWAASYQTATESSIKANAAAHLRALQVDDDVTNLEALVKTYQEKTGRRPSSFSEMQIAGLLRGTPVDPLGRPYKLMSDGRVEVQSPDDLPFIEKALLPDTFRPRPQNSYRQTDNGLEMRWPSQTLPRFSRNIFR